jgi:superfamily I DNA and/or RNA helicase
VGDHRQLPHIVDNAIQKELIEEESVAKDINKHLTDSLFERFYNTLKKLEEKDGIKRVVTLNTQYRMHPVIGDFISKTFYEKYGDPKINSGTPAENLIHNISHYQNKVAISVNIPNIKGEEKKQNGSTFRPIEAKEAIRRAKEILDSDPSISVGIITFYSRQVTELFIEAEKLGMSEKNDSGDYIITKPYQKTIKAEERFRIGSVDAFQGKEFDVVILSLVRSNDIQIKSSKDIRRKYGFLTSYNRLNVAMSRAKKLLIAVGDEEMFKIQQAEEHIFGLYAFYNELINSDYGLSI